MTLSTEHIQSSVDDRIVNSGGLVNSLNSYGEITDVGSSSSSLVDSLSEYRPLSAETPSLSGDLVDSLVDYTDNPIGETPTSAEKSPLALPVSSITVAEQTSRATNEREAMADKLYIDGSALTGGFSGDTTYRKAVLEEAYRKRAVIKNLTEEEDNEDSWYDSFTDGLASGWEGTKAMGNLTAGFAFDVFGANETAANFYADARANDIVAGSYAQKVTALGDGGEMGYAFDSIDNFGHYVAQTLGQITPDLVTLIGSVAAAAATGGTSLAANVGAATAKATIKSLGKAAVKKGIRGATARAVKKTVEFGLKRAIKTAKKTALKTGGKTGLAKAIASGRIKNMASSKVSATVAAYSFGHAQAMSGMYKETVLFGDPNALSANIAAVPHALISLIGGNEKLAIDAFTSKGTTEAAKHIATHLGGNAALKFLGTSMKSGAQEFGEEFFQTMVEQVHNAAVADGDGIDITQMLEAGLQGFIGGLVGGTISATDSTFKARAEKDAHLAAIVDAEIKNEDRVEVNKKIFENEDAIARGEEAPHLKEDKTPFGRLDAIPDLSLDEEIDLTYHKDMVDPSKDKEAVRQKRIDEQDRRVMRDSVDALTEKYVRDGENEATAHEIATRKVEEAYNPESITFDEDQAVTPASYQEVETARIENKLSKFDFSDIKSFTEQISLAGFDPEIAAKLTEILIGNKVTKDSKVNIKALAGMAYNASLGNNSLINQLLNSSDTTTGFGNRTSRIYRQAFKKRSTIKHFNRFLNQMSKTENERRALISKSTYSEIVNKISNRGMESITDEDRDTIIELGEKVVKKDFTDVEEVLTALNFLKRIRHMIENTLNSIPDNVESSNEEASLEGIETLISDIMNLVPSLEKDTNYDNATEENIEEDTEENTEENIEEDTKENTEENIEEDTKENTEENIEEDTKKKPRKQSKNKYKSTTNTENNSSRLSKGKPVPGMDNLRARSKASNGKGAYANPLVFDLETTSSDPSVANITQIAIVNPLTGKQYTTYIDFDFKSADIEALKVNGAVDSNGNLVKRDSIPLLQALSEIKSFIESAGLDSKDTAYMYGFNNHSFDNPILARIFSENNIDLPSIKVVDMYLENVKKGLRNDSSRKNTQVAIAKDYGISINNAHDALGDVTMLAQIVDKTLGRVDSVSIYDPAVAKANKKTKATTVPKSGKTVKIHSKNVDLNPMSKNPKIKPLAKKKNTKPRSRSISEYTSRLTPVQKKFIYAKAKSTYFKANGKVASFQSFDQMIAQSKEALKSKSEEGKAVISAIEEAIYLTENTDYKLDFESLIPIENGSQRVVARMRQISKPLLDNLKDAVPESAIGTKHQAMIIDFFAKHESEFEGVSTKAEVLYVLDSIHKSNGIEAEAVAVAFKKSILDAKVEIDPISVIATFRGTSLAHSNFINSYTNTINKSSNKSIRGKYKAANAQTGTDRASLFLRSIGFDLDIKDGSKKIIAQFAAATNTSPSFVTYMLKHLVDSGQVDNDASVLVRSMQQTALIFESRVRDSFEAESSIEDPIDFISDSRSMVIPTLDGISEITMNEIGAQLLGSVELMSYMRLGSNGNLDTSIVPASPVTGAIASLTPDGNKKDLFVYVSSPRVNEDWNSVSIEDQVRVGDQLWNAENGGDKLVLVSQYGDKKKATAVNFRLIQDSLQKFISDGKTSLDSDLDLETATAAEVKMALALYIEHEAFGGKPPGLNKDGSRDNRLSAVRYETISKPGIPMRKSDNIRISRVTPKVLEAAKSKYVASIKESNPQLAEHLDNITALEIMERSDGETYMSDTGIDKYVASTGLDVTRANLETGKPTSIKAHITGDGFILKSNIHSLSSRLDESPLFHILKTISDNDNTDMVIIDNGDGSPKGPTSNKAMHFSLEGSSIIETTGDRFITVQDLGETEMGGKETAVLRQLKTSLQSLANNAHRTDLIASNFVNNMDNVSLASILSDLDMVFPDDAETANSFKEIIAGLGDTAYKDPVIMKHVSAQIRGAMKTVLSPKYNRSRMITKSDMGFTDKDGVFRFLKGTRVVNNEVVVGEAIISRIAAIKNGYVYDAKVTATDIDDAHRQLVEMDREIFEEMPKASIVDNGDGTFEVKGSLITSTRVPADGPHSTAVARVAGISKSFTDNTIQMNREATLLAGEDFDGDARYVMFKIPEHRMKIPKKGVFDHQRNSNDFFDSIVNDYTNLSTFNNIFKDAAGLDIGTKDFRSDLIASVLGKDFKDNIPEYGTFEFDNYINNKIANGKKGIPAIVPLIGASNFFLSNNVQILNSGIFKNGKKGANPFTIKSFRGKVSTEISTAINQTMSRFQSLLMDDAKNPITFDLGITPETILPIMSLFLAKSLSAKTSSEVSANMSEAVKFVVGIDTRSAKGFLTPVSGNIGSLVYGLRRASALLDSSIGDKFTGSLESFNNRSSKDFSSIDSFTKGQKGRSVRFAVPNLEGTREMKTLEKTHNYEKDLYKFSPAYHQPAFYKALQGYLGNNLSLSDVESVYQLHTILSTKKYNHMPFPSLDEIVANNKDNLFLSQIIDIDSKTGKLKFSGVNANSFFKSNSFVASFAKISDIEQRAIFRALVESHNGVVYNDGSPFVAMGFPSLKMFLEEARETAAKNAIKGVKFTTSERIALVETQQKHATFLEKNPSLRDRLSLSLNTKKATNDDISRIESLTGYTVVQNTDGENRIDLETKTIYLKKNAKLHTLYHEASHAMVSSIAIEDPVLWRNIRIEIKRLPEKHPVRRIMKNKYAHLKEGTDVWYQEATAWLAGSYAGKTHSRLGRIVSAIKAFFRKVFGGSQSIVETIAKNNISAKKSLDSKNNTEDGKSKTLDHRLSAILGAKDEDIQNNRINMSRIKHVVDTIAHSNNIDPELVTLALIVSDDAELSSPSLIEAQKLSKKLRSDIRFESLKDDYLRSILENTQSELTSFYYIKEKNASFTLNELDKMGIAPEKDSIFANIVSAHENLITNDTNRKLLDAIAKDGFLSAKKDIKFTHKFSVLGKTYYASEEYSDFLKNTFSRERFFAENAKREKWYKGAENANAWAKSIRLSLSLFHAVALLKSFSLGSHVKNWYNPKKLWNYIEDGNLAYSDYNDNIRELFRQGFTGDTVRAFGFKSSTSKALGWPISKQISKLTFDVIGRGAKLQSAMLEMNYLRSRYPSMPISEAAYASSMMANNDFGGLNLSRLKNRKARIVGRSRRSTRLSKLLLLGADWTESNLRAVTDMVNSNEAVAHVHRASALRIANRVLMSNMVIGIVNYAFGNHHEGEDLLDSFANKMYDAYSSGDLHWMDADMSDIFYSLAQGDPDKKYYFRTAGHFIDYLKMIPDFEKMFFSGSENNDPAFSDLAKKPAQFALYKGSTFSQFLFSALSGMDTRFRKFKSFDDFMKGTTPKEDGNSGDAPLFFHFLKNPSSLATFAASEFLNSGPISVSSFTNSSSAPVAAMGILGLSVKSPLKINKRFHSRTALAESTILDQAIPFVQDFFKTSDGAIKVSSNPLDYGGTKGMATVYNKAKKAPEYVIERFFKRKNVDYGKRIDGTKKGSGYLGELKGLGKKKGTVFTELSIGVNFDGKETQIPLLVPTLTESQITHLLKGRKATASIIKKAVKHAKKRMASGKSPFADKDQVPGKKTRDDYNFDDTFQKNVNLDRGHLGRFGTTASAADAKHSFTKFNIEPMKSDFNRGAWLDIENEFKSIIQEYGDADVVTGAVKNDWLTPTVEVDNGTRREIPRRFYKAIRYNNGTIKAYIATNNRGGATREVSIDELAKITGYRFFSD